jgi:hypothetical protein
MTMTGASAAWTMPRMTARSGLTYEMIAPPATGRIRVLGAGQYRDVTGLDDPDNRMIHVKHRCG